MVIWALGRDSTLTDRTILWEDVLRVPINPLLGAGFESFWLGARAEALWAKYWWRPNQAHNGYLETYLNLGWSGVLLLAGWIVATFRKASDLLQSDFDIGRFRLALLSALVVYNYTEGAFKALHLVWFVFYLISIDYYGAHDVARPTRVTPHRMASIECGGLSEPRAGVTH
jgi:O-antigen ligase